MSRPRSMTVPALRKMKRDGQKLTMLTAYDSTFARLLDRAGVDIILVGDSLGMVVQGQANTLAVTVDHMAYHGLAVSRVVERAHVVVDMPFLSYHVSDEEAVRNAGRLVQEGGAHSVKLEGGSERASTIEALVRAQIPVMGHIGLTPQSFHVQGGFKVQGKTESEGKRLLEDALAVQEAGAWSIVLEGIPASLATEISQALTIPTIGIGAGNGCDGQVLVIYDVLGMEEDFKPKFVRRYASVGGIVTEAVESYIADVRSGAFPDHAHSFHNRSSRTNAPGKGSAAVTEIGAPQDGRKKSTVASGGYGPSESLPA